MSSESEVRPTVYLAGPVMSMDDGGAGWREDVEAYEREMPIVVWSRDDTPPGEMSPWYRYHADYMTPKLPIALHKIEQLATEGDDE